MKRILALFVSWAVVVTAAETSPPGWLLVEETVAAAVASPQITVVHFWAPWCPNSKVELAQRGWETFIGSYPDVKFIFVTVRSSDDGKAMLAENGVGAQANLTLLQHPNHIRKGEGSLTSFMDLPISWVPSTWIFRGGKLRYALNYGEVRFAMLQQLIRDTANEWEHEAARDAERSTLNTQR
ncbi:MAG: thioredoxin family protein [Opitutaceae bacterium]|nr:thioredoxin family protein [Opitutaceae bacterium]